MTSSQSVEVAHFKNQLITNRMLRAALWYAKQGFPVVPIHHKGKRPIAALVPRGSKDASTDPVVITEWWRKFPNANIAIVARPGGLLVLDVDGEIGAKSLKTLVAEYGPLPLTPESETGGGGSHLLFRDPGIEIKSTVGFRPGIDIRSNAMIVVPPSVHKSGREYRWKPGRRPDQIPHAECPAWLTELLTYKPMRAPETPAWADDSGKVSLASLEAFGGWASKKEPVNRNHTVMVICREGFARGFGLAEVSGVVLKYVQKCHGTGTHPFTLEEADGVLQRQWRTHQVSPFRPNLPKRGGR